MKKVCSFAVSILVLSTYLFVQTGTTVQAQTKSNIETILLEEYGYSSIQYALMDNGEITLSNTITSNPINKADNQTMHSIGSVSKMYTTAVVMSLVDKGLLDIDKPVTEYIHEFKMVDDRYKEITPRMLLNHSSGMYGTSYKGLVSFGKGNRLNHDEFLKTLEGQNLKFSPSEMSTHGNDGFSLLEILVERVTNTDFTDYFVENFALPLGLNLTKTSVDIFDESRLDTFKFSEEMFPVFTINAVGTGGFYSTAEEMCKFGEVLIGNKEELLSKTSAIAMQNEEYKKGIYAEDGNSNFLGYGLGWDNVNAYPFQEYGIKALFSVGGIMLAHDSAILMAIPEHNLVVAVISPMGDHFIEYSLAVEILEDALLEKGIISKIKTNDDLIEKGIITETIMDILPNRHIEYPVITPVKIPTEMSEFSGSYGSASWSETFNVELEGDSIYIDSIEGFISSDEYTYVGDGKFANRYGNSIVSFVNEGENTFIHSDVHFNFSGLKVLNWKALAFQKLDINSISKELQEVWNKRNNHTYYLVDDIPNSLLYYLNHFNTLIELDIDTEMGYVNGGAKIVDKDTAINVLKLYEAMDFKFYSRDGKEYLQSIGLTFINSNDILDIPNEISFSVNIEEDGFVKWYKVGNAQEKEIIVDLPKDATFFIYDKHNNCIYHSMVHDIDKIILPSDGIIGFAGSINNVFHINLKDTNTNLQ